MRWAVVSNRGTSVFESRGAICTGLPHRLLVVYLQLLRNISADFQNKRSVIRRIGGDFESLKFIGCYSVVIRSGHEALRQYLEPLGRRSQPSSVRHIFRLDDHLTMASFLNGLLSNLNSSSSSSVSSSSQPGLCVVSTPSGCGRDIVELFTLSSIAR